MRAIVSASPSYARSALRELRACLPDSAAVSPLAPGVWEVATAGTLAALANALWTTVFVRHICPAPLDCAVRSTDDPAAWVASDLAPLLDRLPGWPPRLPVQAQVRILPGAAAWPPGALARAVGAAAAHAGAEVTGGQAPHVLSVVVAADRAFLGLARRGEQLSPWAGGEARLKAAADELSRSARKLEEALLLFDVPPPPPGASALDLGAAPGGWTQVLLRMGWRVTAVDTGTLSPRLQGTPGLTFVQRAAAHVPLPRAAFLLLTADLNWDPLTAVDCVLRACPALAPDAAGILTVKFFGRDPLEVVAACRRRLQSGFRVAAVRHLFHDRAEATALLRARGPAQPLLP